MKDEAASRLPRVLVVLAALGAALLAGLSATAVLAQANNRISGCYTSGGYYFRIVQDPNNCRSNETAISWNQQGIKGDKGDPGPKGEPGAKGDKGDPGDPAALTAYTASIGYTDSGIAHKPGQGVVVLSKNVPAGSYAINAKVNLHNMDDDDRAAVQCHLMVGGTEVDYTSAAWLDEDIGSDDDAGSWPLQGVVTNFGGGAIAISCGASGDSDRVDTQNAVITAIKIGSAQ